jgi:elongator complex protein 2
LWHQSSENERIWTPGIIQSGHFKEIKDIAWEPHGDFLISTSTDQTTRVHGCWKESNTYHEIARPQVHGYDMQCLAILSRYKFASAAEEKIVRIFQAPGNFVDNLNNLISKNENNVDEEGNEILRSNQKGASVPSLGLSNKIVYDEDLTNGVDAEEKKFRDEYPENYFVPMEMKTPPTEEYLMQNTLWPEMQKLYAHGYEIYSLTATNDGKILASACKATSVEHAEIILWNTSTWKVHQRLRSHKLTVTQMKFSHDGKRLLSVSRDRRFSLFERSDVNSVSFELISTTDKNNGVHERIIWSCDWSHDDLYFATSSRDGKVAIWHKNVAVDEEESSLKQFSNASVINLPSESITAVAFAPILFKESYLIAIGFESGAIQIYTFNGKTCELLKVINQSDSHHLCVNKLQFRPSDKDFHLASCGSDNILRIFEIK